MHHRTGCGPTGTAHRPAREGNAAAFCQLTESRMKPMLAVLAACALSWMLPATPPVLAQSKSDGQEKAAAFFLRTARMAFKWDEPAEPARIIGRIYFVGTK